MYITIYIYIYTCISNSPNLITLESLLPRQIALHGSRKPKPTAVYDLMDFVEHICSSIPVYSSIIISYSSSTSSTCTSTSTSRTSSSSSSSSSSSCSSSSSRSSSSSSSSRSVVVVVS